MQYKIGKNMGETFEESTRHGWRKSPAVQLNSGPVSKNRTAAECQSVLLTLNKEEYLVEKFVYFLQNCAHTFTGLHNIGLCTSK